MKCLVTKYPSVIDNDDIEIFGVMNMVATSNSGVGAYTAFDCVEPTTIDYTVNEVVNTINVPSGKFAFTFPDTSVITINNKWALSYIGGAQKVAITGVREGRTIGKLENLKGLKLRINGNIGMIADCINLETCTLSGATVNGNIEQLYKLKNLTLLSVINTENVTGDVSVLGKSMFDNGRKSGSLVIEPNSKLKNNGTTIGLKNVTLSFSNSGVTISVSE